MGHRSWKRIPVDDGIDGGGSPSRGGFSPKFCFLKNGSLRYRPGWVCGIVPWTFPVGLDHRASESKALIC